MRIDAERFFGGDARRDIDAIVALFTGDAVVVDERQTWQGREAIRRWQDGPAARDQAQLQSRTAKVTSRSWASIRQ